MMRRVIVTVDIPDAAVQSHGLQPAAAVSVTEHGNSIVRFLKNAVVEGTLPATFSTEITDTAGVQDEWNIVCVQAEAAGQIVTVAGVALTEGVDFDAGATDAECAANLSAAILAAEGLEGMFESGAVVDDTVTLVSAGFGGIGAVTTDDVLAFIITQETVGVAATVVTEKVTSAFRGG